MGEGTSQGDWKMGALILVIFIQSIVNAVVIYLIMQQYIKEVREIDFRIMQSAYRLGRDTQEEFPIPSEDFGKVKKAEEATETLPGSVEMDRGVVVKFRNNLKSRQMAYRRSQKMAQDALLMAVGPSMDPKKGGGSLEG
jgi:hypothetical protein